MALNVGELFANLSLKTDNFDNNLSASMARLVSSAAQIKTRLSSAGQSGGRMFASGLAAGIASGRSAVISAANRIAAAAIAAANAKLKIASPSRVFRDEVGAMTMKGFGQGVMEESKEQAKIIRNAARYLTDEAREGAIIHNATTNHRTYNQNSTVNLSGNTFTIRDEQDIYALATEIATLTRRQQRGKGLRMA